MSNAKSAATVLNYRVHPVEGQTDNYLGPELDHVLNGVDNYITAGASVSIPSEKLAFYFSGLRSGDDGPLQPYGGEFNVSNAMVKVDMTVPGNAVWSKLSLDSTVPGRADAQLVWIPVSQQGILLAIGGVVHPASLYDWSLGAVEEAENVERGPGFMTTIAVYDIANNQWYNQETSGTQPAPLAGFCSVVAHEADTSSFDVYIYGGDDGWTLDPQATARDQVWVLSVPSFTWSKVGQSKADHGRSAHICTLPSPGQMLVFGGWNLNHDGFCIRDGSVIDVFNLNDHTWTKEYDPSSTTIYKASNTVQKPERSIDSGVRALFDQPYDDTKIKTWYPYKGGHSTKPTPVAAIAGGVVGGVVAVAIAFLVWYCWPSHATKRRARRESDAGTTSTLRDGRVARWLLGISRHSAEVPVIPKDLASESTTEVEGQGSPPPHAELYGDYFRPPAPYVSPVGGSPAAEINSVPSSSPRRVSYISARPPRSPRSPTAGSAGSVEHDGEEVHEKDGEIRNSQQPEIGQGPLDFRQHHQYPYSIDRVTSSDANSNTGQHSHRQGALGSHNSHLSGHSRQHSNTAPSPIPAARSMQEVTEGNASANEKGIDTLQRLTHRPSHQRNQSSMSSNLPITPPANDNNDRPAMEMRMSATSQGPVSPLLAQGRTTSPRNRPASPRQGSSGFSGLSGEARNITLPPPVHPMSPSSVYSPTSAGQGTNAGNATSSSAWTEQKIENESALASAEATLIGTGTSPMTEKMNPMGAMAESLQSPRTPTSPGTRRKPVGSRAGPTGLGLDKSAYEENGGSDGR